jgi:Arc/MetJ family transcription regulator
MRTNVEIDDKLISEAMELSGARTKREAVDIALRRLVQIGRQGELRKLRGLGWEGDLEAMRRD